jgi:hypothetical protein
LNELYIGEGPRYVLQCHSRGFVIPDIFQVVASGKPYTYYIGSNELQKYC